MSKLFDWLQTLLGRADPTADAHQWHRFHPAIVPFRAVDGTLIWANGKVWRRFRNGRWEYQEDEMTDAEWEEFL